jgi:hypothetical protein
MEHLKLTFEDIMQSNILYYDPIAENACFDICNHLRIDNMPGIDGLHYYERIKGMFERNKIEAFHRVSVNDNLISNESIEKFKSNSHNVLFVYEEDLLRGVVHISDYNRDVVLQKIQDDVLSFERKLRQLILLSGFKNSNMLEYFEKKLKDSTSTKNIDYYSLRIRNFNNRKGEIDSLGPFQLFEFNDLMNFTNSSFSKWIHKVNTYELGDAKKSGTDILRELRNLAMHGKNPVSINRETSIYSLESLHYLKQSLDVLRKESSEVSKKIRLHPDFMLSIELENRKKLEIIHDHHPKALEYFLGF